MRIGIVGGGPSALFILKRIIEAKRNNLSVAIFEKKDKIGAGMPYSAEGACEEHITNVSGNEIPDLVTSVEDWVGTHAEAASRYHLSVKNFNDYKVLPRLLFGEYLSRQFDLLLKKADRRGLPVKVYYRTEITDIRDLPATAEVNIFTSGGLSLMFDKVVICSGHYWPKKFEGKIPGYYDSPYPPQKLAHLVNRTVAIRGASLTAIDALRTLALNNGRFEQDSTGKKSYRLRENCRDFKLVLHSRNGMLPAVRFHLEDSHLAKDSVLRPEEIAAVRAQNDGFLPLDYVFQRNFLDGLKDNRPEFYQLIKGLKLEDFVEVMMMRREETPAFDLLKVEYAEAELSISLKRSVYWKEMLAVLSFAMNYPAKYFSAEDMLRLQKSLMPLISIVIAFAPQDSVEEMIALYDAGILSLISVGDESKVEARANGGIDYVFTDPEGKKICLDYDTFVDCIGQPHLNSDDLPFPSLVADRTIAPASVKFRDQNTVAAYLSEMPERVYRGDDNHYYLKVPGLAIDDHFRIVGAAGEPNDRLYIMAVPFIGGYNPDYSGLDFGEAASARIISKLVD